MTCWFCGEKMIWQSDFTYEEYGREGEGQVTVLLCSSCEASAEFSITDEPGKEDAK
tara:strand:+ start:1037 stop:1204 length:168 start_codon:yes stop_codon:yes gene_type:complete